MGIHQGLETVLLVRDNRLQDPLAQVQAPGVEPRGYEEVCTPIAGKSPASKPPVCQRQEISVSAILPCTGN